MKTILFSSLALAAAIGISVAEDKPAGKSLGEKTSNTLEKIGEKTKEAGRSVADGTKKAVDAVVDSVTPDKDAKKIDVKMTDHAIDMPKSIGSGKTAFVVTNHGKDKQNFEITGEGLDKKFMMSLSPDETKTLNVDLKPGSYKVFSPGKEAAESMKMTLTVK